ncbi:MAG: UPF0176 protein [Cryomorphaceae bacterium]|jgi:UPF0176 protein
MTEAPYQVLLYYFYVEIADPDAYREEQRALCESLELLGRIIVGNEGINGTVSGTVENCQKYMEALRNDPLTAEVEFKIDSEQAHVFPKLSVKSRVEIVSLGLGEEDFSPNETTGNYLNPQQWKEAMDDPNAVIIDTRNDYEWKLGKFKNAILPPVDNFRDLPQWVKDNREMLDGKKILAYCTGGIRCEKFSGYLVREGFEDVNQLHGGIVTYGKDPVVKGEDYEGQCYVFDERIGVPVNAVNPTVIAHCVHCGEPSERYINCSNKHGCNAQHFSCESCDEKNQGCCSDKCQAIITTSIS